MHVIAAPNARLFREVIEEEQRANTEAWNTKTSRPFYHLLGNEKA